MSAMFLVESSYRSMVGHLSLIDEKISIPTPMRSRSRARLKALLDKNLNSCNSTIISGRAGTGKTTLVLDFAKNSGLPVAWYKVDAPESEITNFFQYLIASIQRKRPRFGGKALIQLIQTADCDQITGLAEA